MDIALGPRAGILERPLRACETPSGATTRVVKRPRWFCLHVEALDVGGRVGLGEARLLRLRQRSPVPRARLRHRGQHVVRRAWRKRESVHEEEA